LMKKTTADKVMNLVSSTSDYSNSKYTQLINYGYTKINLMSVLKDKQYQKSKHVRELSRHLDKLYSGDYDIISPNGDIYSPFQEGTRTYSIASIITETINKCNKTNYDPKCMNYNKLRNINAFRSLINYIKSKGSEIIIFLPPFSPTFFHHVVDNNNFSTHNDKILTILREEGLNKIVGSYDPSVLNLNDSDFSDSIHPTVDALRSVFKNIKIDTL
jgi:hypothetical protein